MQKQPYSIVLRREDFKDASMWKSVLEAAGVATYATEITVSITLINVLV